MFSITVSNQINNDFDYNVKKISAEPLEAFGKIAHQLLQDVQERLVFRANRYLHSDILNYKPSAGDLAYPEKLELMEVRIIMFSL